MRMSNLYFALFLTAILSGAATQTNAQANVIENQTNFIYVDAQTGSNGNSGAKTAPLKTIQAAVNKANALNEKGIGAKVIVNPGTYREFVNIGNYRVTNAPLTVQAAVTGMAIISGADVLTGWNQQSPSVYTHQWIDNVTGCALPSGWPTTYAPIALNAETVFVNGAPLTQVLSSSDLQPGTFYVDAAAGNLDISPAPGVNMATAVVEASARRQTLSVEGRTNVVLRGLAMRGAANCMNSAAAAVNGSNNVLVDSIQSTFNNWGGLGVFSSTHVTVQNSIASYNGGVGFMGNQDVSTLFDFNESDYNNWRGAQAAFYDWAMGGTKLFAMHSATVQNHFSYNNQAQGLWFDTDNKNITIDNATLSGSVAAALQIERDEGPIMLKNSSLCSSGSGINVLTSEGLTVQNNLFYNNGGMNKYQAQFYLAGQAGGKLITDWQTGQTYNLFTTGTVITGNTVVDAGVGQLLFSTYLSGTDWSDFANTISASDNTWYDASNPASFKVVNGHYVTFPQWQSAMASDYSSTWAAPMTSPVAACTPPAPSYNDFNVNVDSNIYAFTSGSAVSTVRVNSFGTGAVNLSVEDLPTGITASLSQQSVVSGVVTLTFTSSYSAVAATVPVTLWATTGSQTHSVTFYLQVAPYGVAPAATPALSPAAGTYTST